MNLLASGFLKDAEHLHHGDRQVEAILNS